METLSDPGRAHIFKDASFGNGHYEEVGEVSHTRFCANASYANPNMGGVGKRAFVSSREEFCNNMNAYYFGSDATNIWDAMWDVEFQGRIVIAGGAATLCSLSGAFATADVYRDPCRTRLPVDAVNCDKSDVDFFVIGRPGDTEEQRHGRAERWRVPSWLASPRHSKTLRFPGVFAGASG